MLTFSRDFFREETREGFTIDATMKTFWAAEMEVLREISELCERHDIQWYAAYGTLLGAVRHKGYVPWDDDMDIWMFREDYEKFLKIAPLELPHGYIVQSPLTEVGYTQFHSCVFNALSISIEKERLERFHGCPFATGIDIFPLDYLPDEEEEREGEKTVFNLICNAVWMIKKEEKTEEDRNDLDEALNVLEDFSGVHFSRELLETKEEKKLLSEVYKLGNRLCASYHEEDGSNVVVYMGYHMNPTKVYKKEWFSDVIMQPFENVFIPVPVGYDEILKVTYGNYQVRIQNGSCHDYPLYNKQLNYLRGIVDDMEEKTNRLEELIEKAREKNVRIADDVEIR